MKKLIRVGGCLRQACHVFRAALALCGCVPCVLAFGLAHQPFGRPEELGCAMVRGTFRLGGGAPGFVASLGPPVRLSFPPAVSLHFVCLSLSC